MTADRTHSPEKVLAAICDYIESAGIPPTIREIGDLAEISSTSHVCYYLDKLESQGLIRRIPGVARGIVLVEDNLPRVADEEDLDDDELYEQVLAGRWRNE